MKHTKTLPLILLAFFPMLLTAQPRFRAGVVAGISASQIDGDISRGFNKLGFLGGLRVIARLKGRSDASMEILYAQRGCQNELIPSDTDPTPYSLTLNYIEVPIQWHFKDWLVEHEDAKINFHRISVNAGLSYARLLGSKVDDDFNWLNSVAPDYLKKNDLSVVLGANFFFNRHSGITLRWNQSLVLLYDSRNSPQGGKSWNGRCLYFQTVYLF
ncbi:MAG: PorT family protein [Phycisphaerae bacterium]|nr:PorT family protein [Saprospiraceae bacterium]